MAIKRWWNRMMLRWLSVRGEVHVHKWNVEKSGAVLCYTCECAPKTKHYIRPGTL